MAPTNGRSTRRHGNTANNDRGRPYRHANTHAGVSRDYSDAPRDRYRSRDAHRRPVRHQRSQAPANAPTGPRSSFSRRMTFDDGRDRATPSNGDSYRPQPQRGRPRPQERLTDARVSGGAVKHAMLNRQINHHALAQVMATTAVNADESEMDDIDKLIFATPRAASIASNTGQASITFGSSQLTQPADVSLPSSPVLPPTMFTPHIRSVRPATSSRPIRMFNAPVVDVRRVEADAEAIPKRTERPVNTYRGKDAIKQLVQNKTLQRLFADKPTLKPPKKSHLERMDLRIGASKVTK
ncbi:hypothetical protein CC86DRAFT_163172 [Ophiobolus disseminans]|uniref:Uncharacterized protein n=1 Tax=Ophiobolus disseminans TaxID=1469910 RepID=A0A6A7ABF8_9PLEO|nr:hypothetical protein CC86DRAFT_163172 [Ophiobolus disseminans]